MNNPPTLAPATAPPVLAARDAFDRLSFLGWRWGLAAIVAGMAVSFFLFGYALIYWRNADMDFMVVYNALALNDGKPQRFFDHTAYLSILSLQYWFRLLHGLGLLDAWTLSAIPPASDVAGFDAAMTSAVRAGRVPPASAVPAGSDDNVRVEPADASGTIVVWRRSPSDPQRQPNSRPIDSSI